MFSFMKDLQNSHLKYPHLRKIDIITFKNLPIYELFKTDLKQKIGKIASN